MTIQYLLDTDWVIHYLNEHRGIVQRLDALLDDGLGLSIISLAELYEGVFTHAIRREMSRISMIFYAG